MLCQCKAALHCVPINIGIKFNIYLLSNILYNKGIMSCITRYRSVSSNFDKLINQLDTANEGAMIDMAREAAECTAQNWSLPWLLNYFCERTIKSFYEKMLHRCEIISSDRLQ